MTTVDPKLWGKSGWIFLHSVTLGYPNNPTEEDKNNYKIFFNSIKNILPCNNCRQNYSNSIEKYNLTDDVLITRDTLVNWLINIRSDDRYTFNKNISVKTILNEIGITANSMKIMPNNILNTTNTLNTTNKNIQTKYSKCNC